MRPKESFPHGTAPERLGLRPGDRVAILGSGGKTSLLRRLAQGGEWEVILTTTTRMGPPGHPEEPPFLPFPGLEEFAGLWARLPAPRRALTGRFHPGEQKLGGLTPEEVDGLAALPGLDLLAAEVDGSRTLPAKAHAPYEPVLFPSCTAGVAVLGMRALGRQVAEGQVHRPHLMAERYGWPLGHRLELEDLERLALSYLAFYPDLPTVLVLSQSEAVPAPTLRHLADRLRGRAGRILRQGLDGLEVLA